MLGRISIKKSVPFLKVSLERTTIFMVFLGHLLEGSGRNKFVSTALGIEDIWAGSIEALYNFITLGKSSLCQYGSHKWHGPDQCIET